MDDRRDVSPRPQDLQVQAQLAGRGVLPPNHLPGQIHLDHVLRPKVGLDETARRHQHPVFRQAHRDISGCSRYESEVSQSPAAFGHPASRIGHRL